MADKRVAELIRRVEKWPGWRVQETKDGFMLYPPDKSQSGVLVHKTPGARKRWYENTVALLRQRGGPI